MNITRFKTLSAAALAAVACALAVLPMQARADIVLNEHFAAPLSPDIWRAVPKNAVTAAEGILTLTAEGPAEKYGVAFAVTVNPTDLLNFTKRQVELQFKGFEFSGDSTPVNHVFIVAMTSDSEDPSKASSELRLRFDGLGSVMLIINDKGASQPALAWKQTVALPVKSVKLTLKPTGADLALEDAAGAKSWHIPFESALDKWTNATPTLRLQAQRAPGEGVTKVSVQGLKVESVPVTSK